MKQIEDLKRDILSEDWEVRMSASDALATLGGEQALDVLLPLLSSEVAVVRNAAALALREIGDDRAVGPLVHAINNPANRDNRGTLVYALETLDCRHLFRFLFDLALSANYECQNHALTILWEQGFCVSDEDIADAQRKLDIFQASEGRSEDTGLLISDLNYVLENLRE